MMLHVIADSSSNNYKLTFGSFKSSKEKRKKKKELTPTYL